MASPCKSVAAHEIANFAKLQKAWWDPQGPLRTLHQLNPHRVQYIRNAVASYSPATSSSNASSRDPLADRRILDVGCGGGVLAEALARCGANVKAIDMCAESIDVAQQRQKLQPSSTALTSLGGVKKDDKKMNLDFELKSVFEFDGAKEQFDVVVASEVLEHVENPVEFVQQLSSLVAVDGCLVVTTINKTLFSGATYIGLAEGTGVVPPGTHDWAKFIPPQDMSRVAGQSGVQCVDVSGVVPMPDVVGSIWGASPASSFKLTKKVTAGHYFWTGVKLPQQ